MGTRATIVAVLYFPALIISFSLMLPIIFLLLLSRNQGIEFNDIDQFKLILFLDKLSYMHDNIEGDFWDFDPLPFLAKTHMQVASRLLATIRTGAEWKKIDFCIGKVVEVGGD